MQITITFETNGVSLDRLARALVPAIEAADEGGNAPKATALRNIGKALLTANSEQQAPLRAWLEEEFGGQ